MIGKLNQFWDEAFNGVPQVSHLFRDLFADRWVRFHCLPESKRYPDSEAEFQTVLSRHNHLLDGLASGKRIILATTGHSSSPAPSRDEPVLAALDPSAESWRTLPMHLMQDEDPDDPNYWHVFASEWEWSPGILDPILRLVANEQLSNVFIFSIGDTWLYHPYDGAADVILPSGSQRDALRDRHRAWLSPHPAGL